MVEEVDTKIDERCSGQTDDNGTINVKITRAKRFRTKAKHNETHHLFPFQTQISSFSLLY